MDQPTDPLDWYIKNWQTWMHAPGLHLNIKIGGVYASSSTDFDSMCEAMDLRLAESVGAIVDNDLNPAQRCAVYHKYLHAVYRFPRQNFPEMLTAAREIIRMALYNKGILIE